MNRCNLLVVLLVLVTAAAFSPVRVQGEPAVVGLRGEASPPATTSPPNLPQQRIQEGSFSRAWEEQPPLIPHRMEKYEIDLKVNQCLSCHDRSKVKESGATEIAESHYKDRDGNELQQLSRARWFCTQCHVPQSDIQPQVENVFRGAAE